MARLRSRRTGRAHGPVLLRDPPPGQVQRPRIVQRPGTEGPLRVGSPSRAMADGYHRMLVLSWPRFVGGVVAVYLGLNLLFGTLYALDLPGIDRARSFGDAFFFSIQTMATIGYGVLAPVDAYTNIVVTIETLFALGVVALVTGLTFARFSRPTAQVAFSRVACVFPYNGVPTLAVRLANGRRNQILEADVAMTLVRNERSTEGAFMRRFYDLHLARAHTPIFGLTFLVMHPIDELSPLHGTPLERLIEQDAELLVTVTGLDETMSQTIHARTSYIATELLFGQRFRDMFGFTESGRIAIDFRVFHETEPA